VKSLEACNEGGRHCLINITAQPPCITTADSDTILVLEGVPGPPSMGGHDDVLALRSESTPTCTNHPARSGATARNPFIPLPARGGGMSSHPGRCSSLFLTSPPSLSSERTCIGNGRR